MKRQKLIIRLDDFLPYRLSVASNAVSDLIAQAYEMRFQITIPEWRMIAILAEHGEATPLAISRTARMDKISVTRTGKRLLERRLANARAHPRDRRSHILSLTAGGLRLYEQVAPIALKLEAALLAQFSSHEISQLSDMLQRIENAAFEAVSD